MARPTTARVRTVETLMDATLELRAAMRADELEDQAVGKARQYVRGIIANLKAAGEHDEEHDRHLSAAAAQLSEALGLLEGVEQQRLFLVVEERAS